MKDNPISRHFDTEHLKEDLGKRSVRGGAITGAAQVVKFSITLASTVLLARLLDPEDYGLIAMVAPVTGFLALFKDLGLSLATIQRDKISHGQVSNLFWVNVTASMLLLVIAAGCAPLLASFYEDPRLAGVTIALSMTFLLGGLAAQHQALLQRQMHFGKLASIEITSLVLAVSAAVLGALWGWQYWSLVIMTLTQAGAYAALCWVTSGWLPGLPSRDTGVRQMLAFGGHYTGFNVVNYFARNIDNVLIGKIWGDFPLGLYSRAYTLLLLPLSQINGPISAVAIPSLSRLANEPDRYRRYFLKVLRIMTSLSMPIVILLTINADLIVHLALGEKWSGAAPIFQCLGIAGLVQTSYTSLGWILVSLGQTRRLFLYAMVACPLTVAAIFAGLPWGALGVATGYSAISLLLFLPGVVYTTWHTPIRVGAFFACLLPGLFAGVLAAMGSLIGSMLAPENMIAIDVLARGSLAILFWVAANLMMGGIRQPFGPFQEVLGLLRASRNESAA